MAQHSYTLYLAKNNTTDFDSLLSERGIQRINDSTANVIEPDGFGDAAKLYILTSVPMAPKWLVDLKAEFGIEDVKTRSLCALLMFKTAGRIFVVSFAHGWMYLEESRLEPDFGLRLAINTLDETQLKRIESSNLGDALRDVSLSPYFRNFQSFRVDAALDLIKKISGSTNSSDVLNQVTGAQSAKLYGHFDLSDLPGLAPEIISASTSSKYKNTSFRQLDDVLPVRDRELKLELDELAASKIRTGDANFELGLPHVGVDESVGYKFIGPGLRGHYADLLFRDYITALGSKRMEYSRDNLKKHRIVAVFEDGVRPDVKWTIHKALLGSLECNDLRYAINEGEWYCIDQLFRDSVEKTFKEVYLDWDDGSAPPSFQKHVTDKGSTYESESQINERLAELYGFVLMDRKLLSIPDTKITQLEACDLLDLSGKRFIHVKRSSRSSSVLNHFFKQGSYSAQCFRKYLPTWNKLQERVEETLGSAANHELQKTIADNRMWRIEYWIIDAPRASGEFNIPFFSKISLQDEVRNLRSMSYEVALKFIPLIPQNI